VIRPVSSGDSFVGTEHHRQHRAGREEFFISLKPRRVPFAHGVGCVPLIPTVRRWQELLAFNLQGVRGLLLNTSASVLNMAVLALIFFASISLSAAGTYNPFIYFRF
jgi:hypothetical protein